jgi:hypothetical protein
MCDLEDGYANKLSSLDDHTMPISLPGYFLLLDGCAAPSILNASISLPGY